MKGLPDATADRAWTFEAVKSVSRTFALTIDLLEEPVASWVCTGYLLCRVADTVEDDPAIPPGVRADLLDEYDAVLDPDADVDAAAFLASVDDARSLADADDADWAVVARTDRVLRAFESFDPAVQAAIRPVVREMTGGMAGFLRRYADRGGLRLRTVDELESYCWYVAGTVGTLVTNLLDVYGAGSDPAPEDARAFALLLQLVNVAKDVRADYETENNVYLPGEWLADEGVDHDAVGDPARADAVTRVVRRLVDHAASYAPGARRYLHTLPEGDAGILPAFGLPYLLALGTMRELRERATAAVAEPTPVKMDRPEVEALFDEVADGLTQAELTRLADVVRERPYHESELSAQ
jgi:farnesyl-diphosphate farnesyltransferase